MHDALDRMTSRVFHSSLEPGENKGHRRITSRNEFGVPMQVLRDIWSHSSTSCSGSTKVRRVNRARPGYLICQGLSVKDEAISRDVWLAGAAVRQRKEEDAHRFSPLPRILRTNRALAGRPSFLQVLRPCALGSPWG